jgi:hypothetical protein
VSSVIRYNQILTMPGNDPAVARGLFSRNGKRLIRMLIEFFSATFLYRVDTFPLSLGQFAFSHAILECALFFELVELNIQMLSRVFHVLIEPVQIQRQLAALYLSGKSFAAGYPSVTAGVEFTAVAGGTVFCQLLLSRFNVKGIGERR